MQKTQTVIENINPSVNKTLGKAVFYEKQKKQFPTKMFISYAKEAAMYLLGFLSGSVNLFRIFNPLGIAILATYFFEGQTFYIMSGAVLAGLIFGGVPYLVKYIGCVLFCVLLNILFSNKIRSPSPIHKAVCGSISILIAGILFAAINGMSRYFTFMAIMEAGMVFSFTFVADKGIKLLKNGMKRRIMTSEEIISLSLVLAVAVAGSAEVYIQNIPLKFVLSTALILVAGYRGGAGIGAATGILLSFALLICGKIDMALFCALSLSGLLCGSFKQMGRFVTVASFFIGISILIFYMDKELLSREFLIGVSIGGILFLAIPKKTFAFINTYACYENEFNEDEYYIRMKEMTEQKLKQFSKSFYALARTFEHKEEKKTITDKKDISKTIDQVAERACKGCGLKVYCWQEDFYSTYQTVFSALSKCERKGFVCKGDISEKFVKNCIRADIFVETINRLYELYQSNEIWKSKIEESRELVSQQLFAVGHIIESLSGKLDIRVIFKESLEKEVRVALEKQKIQVQKVSVMENSKGALEVIVQHPNCCGKRICCGQILPIVNKVLGKRMKKEGGLSCILSGDGICTLKLIEESRLKLATGIASQTKEDSNVSGDSYTCMEMNNGMVLLALSDGMGSGVQASRESTDTIELLEQFIESGFEKDLAIKMINSVLILKSTEEIFSTLDICSVDLYSGKAEFIKIGAAAAYLIRNGVARAIRSQSLPVGVLNHIEIDKNDMLLKAGDVIVMMTDGVADLLNKKGEDEKWLEGIFAQLCSNNPQDIADYILIQARKSIGGEIRDDMTVLAARVWEKL